MYAGMRLGLWLFVRLFVLLFFSGVMPVFLSSVFSNISLAWIINVDSPRCEIVMAINRRSSDFIQIGLSDGEFFSL